MRALPSARKRSSSPTTAGHVAAAAAAGTKSQRRATANRPAKRAAGCGPAAAARAALAGCSSRKKRPRPSDQAPEMPAQTPKTSEGAPRAGGEDPAEARPGGQGEKEHGHDESRRGPGPDDRRQELFADLLEQKRRRAREREGEKQDAGPAARGGRLPNGPSPTPAGGCGRGCACGRARPTESPRAARRR